MELLTERLRSCREEDLKPLAAAIAPPAVSDWPFLSGQQFELPPPLARTAGPWGSLASLWLWEPLTLVQIQAGPPPQDWTPHGGK